VTILVNIAPITLANANLDLQPPSREIANGELSKTSANLC